MMADAQNNQAARSGRALCDGGAPMLVYQTLHLSDHALVAVVGAGGKTTLIHRLATELSRRAACVVCTTTTAVWEPEGVVIVHPSADDLLDAVARRAAPGCLWAAWERRMEWDAALRRQRRKLGGVPVHIPRALAALAGVDDVLVEADGARGRSIKAPAAHEPAMPEGATHVVAVVGADALGRPLDERIAHRPERISALLGVPCGATLTAEHVAALMAHPEGGRKGVPPGASFTVFINKVEGSARLDAARAIAARLTGAAGVDAVVAGAAQAEDAVVEVWP